MWLFLYTEIMLFGGIFVLYAAYYHQYPADFTAGGSELDIVIGTINTVILLVSSFTVASAISAMERRSGKTSLVLLGVTILLGIVFLANKYVEWNHKFELGISPGSDSLLNGPPGRNIFYALYFSLTGLHALHVIIGLSALGTCLVLVWRGKITGTRMNILDNSGLYWHLVDMIWIFLFPLFYLIL